MESGPDVIRKELEALIRKGGVETTPEEEEIADKIRDAMDGSSVVEEAPGEQIVGMSESNPSADMSALRAELGDAIKNREERIDSTLKTVEAAPVPEAAREALSQKEIEATTATIVEAPVTPLGQTQQQQWQGKDWRHNPDEEGTAPVRRGRGSKKGQKGPSETELELQAIQSRVKLQDQNGGVPRATASVTAPKVAQTSEQTHENVNKPEEREGVEEGLLQAVGGALAAQEVESAAAEQSKETAITAGPEHASIQPEDVERLAKKGEVPNFDTTTETKNVPNPTEGTLEDVIADIKDGVREAGAVDEAATKAEETINRVLDSVPETPTVETPSIPAVDDIENTPEQDGIPRAPQYGLPTKREMDNANRRMRSFEKKYAENQETDQKTDGTEKESTKESGKEKPTIAERVGMLGHAGKKVWGGIMDRMPKEAFAGLRARSDVMFAGVTADYYRAKAEKEAKKYGESRGVLMQNREKYQAQRQESADLQQRFGDVAMTDKVKREMKRDEDAHKYFNASLKYESIGHLKKSRRFERLAGAAEEKRAKAAETLVNRAEKKLAPYEEKIAVVEATRDAYEAERMEKRSLLDKYVAERERLDVEMQEKRARGLLKGANGLAWEAVLKDLGEKIKTGKRELAQSEQEVAYTNGKVISLNNRARKWRTMQTHFQDIYGLEVPESASTVAVRGRGQREQPVDTKEVLSSSESPEWPKERVGKESELIPDISLEDYVVEWNKMHDTAMPLDVGEMAYSMSVEPGVPLSIKLLEDKLRSVAESQRRYKGLRINKRNFDIKLQMVRDAMAYNQKHN